MLGSASSTSPSRPFSSAALHEALAVLPADAWSLPSTFTATGVHHGYRRVVLVDHGRLLEAAESFRFVLDRFEPVRDAWLSWIDPGGYIVCHRDGSPWFERWQVPVQAAGTLGGVTAVEGVPFRVEQWLPHSVRNEADHARVHIVIDRDIVIDRGPLPFEVFQTGDPNG